MINHYLRITEEVFTAIRESGLEEECESISVGVLGDNSELPKLQELLAKYPKAKIIAHSEKTDYYEFWTISRMKEEADNSPLFYGLYLHSKSVMTTPDKVDDLLYKDFWRAYMLHWTVTKWRQCYHALDLRDIEEEHVGYDIVACRIVSARKSISGLMHGSGNYVFVNSEYLKSLKLVKHDTYYDGQNQYSGGHAPEMLWWSGQPITYTPCQMFQIGFPFDKGTFREYMDTLQNKEKYIL